MLLTVAFPSGSTARSRPTSSRPEQRLRPRRAQRASGRLDLSKENWDQGHGVGLVTRPDSCPRTVGSESGTHRRCERPRSVPRWWLCRPGLAVPLLAANGRACVMESIPALSWHGPVLPAKERSRDGMSSAGAQVRRPELAGDSNCVSPAPDTGVPPPLPPAPRLLTARDVAEQLSVSSETVLHWTRCGELRGVRLPSRALRYRDADLESWLEERATPRRGSVSHLKGAAHRDTLAAVSHHQRRGEDQHAADSAGSGIQARLR